MTVDVPREASDFVQSFLDAPTGQLEEALWKYRFSGKYTGAYFESMVGDNSSPDRFDVVDVVSLWTLSVEPSASIIATITGPDFTEAEPVLRQWPDRDLAELDEDEILHLNSSATESDLYAYPGLGAVWDVVIAVHGMGQTTTSKLLAKKRPKLVPIFDTVVASELGLTGSGQHWLLMHHLLRANDFALRNRLQELTETEAGRGLSQLRVFDILAWLVGKGWLSLEQVK